MVVMMNRIGTMVQGVLLDVFLVIFQGDQAGVEVQDAMVIEGISSHFPSFH